MVKGSSARKVARVAASSGGKRARKQRNLGFPLAIAAVVIAGLLLVAFAREDNKSAAANDTPPRASIDPAKPSDHWHAAFAVDICGQEKPAVQDHPEDKQGIHTHGDGVIHIHPFVTRAAGKGANLGRFFDQVGMHVTDSEIRMSDKKIYREGATTCSGKPGKVVVAVWNVALKSSGKKPDRLVTSNFNKVRFTRNYQAFTLAFLPKGVNPSPPSSSPNLIELGAADGSGTGGVTSSTQLETGPGSQPAPTTTAVAPANPSSTTAKTDSTATSGQTGTTKP